MKISLMYLALATAISIKAAAINDQDECFADGGPCNTIKRAADAMAEAVPGYLDPGHHQCRYAGGICYKGKRDLCGPSCLKAKRSALALAEAVAEAAPFADSAHHQCFGYGGGCYKAKRNALAAAADLADAETSADPDSQDDVETCHASEGPCETVKRAAKAVAEAMAEADPGYLDPGHHQCRYAGGMCYKAKRALGGLTEVVDGIL